MENIISTISTFDNDPGSILISGFNKGDKSTALLIAMKSKHIKPRDFTIVDTFQDSPWQVAFDFCNEVKNRIKKNGEFLKEDFQNYSAKKVPTVILIDHNSKEVCYSAIKKFLTTSSDKAMIICCNTSVSKTEVTKSIPSGYKKSKVFQLPTKEVVIIKEKSDIDKIKIPVRTRSVLT